MIKIMLNQQQQNSSSNIFQLFQDSNHEKLFVQKYFLREEEKVPGSFISKDGQPSKCSTRFRLYSTIIFYCLCSFLQGTDISSLFFYFCAHTGYPVPLFCIWRHHRKVFSYISIVFASCHNHRKVSSFSASFLYTLPPIFSSLHSTARHCYQRTAEIHYLSVIVVIILVRSNHRGHSWISQ